MNNSLWQIQDIVSATNGHLIGNTIDGISGVSIDTRLLSPGDLFIAINGEQFDGHDFVQAAFEAGASAAIVQEEFHLQSDSGCVLVKVADTLQALNDLGHAARNRSSAKFIAVTGSVGKTGTKLAIADALSRSAETHSSEKSYNNHFGVPLSLSRMPVSARYGVFEVGMNHPGEIEPLSQMIKPDISVITTIEPVHAEFFDTIDDIARAKAEVFCGMSAGAKAVLNRDNRYFSLLNQLAEDAGVEVFSFGESEQSDARLKEYSLGPEHSEVQIELSTGEGQPRPVKYRIGSPGYHLVMNSIAVLLTVDLVGGSLDKALSILESFKPSDGRGKRTEVGIKGGTITLIDESYNANPASMRAALATVGHIKKQTGQRHIAVLGDMLELGAKSKEYHRELKPVILASGFDLVFACGNDMWGLYDSLEPHLQGAYKKKSADLIPGLFDDLRPGDIVIVKGSLGSQMGRIVEALVSISETPQLEQDQ